RSRDGGSGPGVHGRAYPAPSSLGRQSAMCTPLGTYRKAIRLGPGPCPPGPEGLPRPAAGAMASSQGRAMAVPRPRITVRRESFGARVMVVPSSSMVPVTNGPKSSLTSTPPLHERVALHDLEHQPGEPVLAR